MGSNAKRQLTMAKRAREQALRDKRARKLEKKRAAAESRTQTAVASSRENAT
jgi:hypothetical protein